MKECTYLTCNRPSDSLEKAKKSELEKIAKGRGQGERAKDPPTLSLLLSSTFVFLHSPFRATVHSPLPTTPRTGQFIVGQRVFSKPRDLQMSIREHLKFKRSYSRCNYSCFRMPKTPLFFYFPFCCRGKFFAICF